MRGRWTIIGTAICVLLAACASHESKERRREPKDGYLLRSDEARDPVPSGVEMWVDAKGMDMEINGGRTHLLDFGPEAPSMQSRGDRRVHELTATEKNKQADPDALLIVHVDPELPAAYLAHALHHVGYWFHYAFVVETEDGPRVVYARSTIASKGEGGLFSTLHVDVGLRGTTAKWHAPNTGPAQWWEVNTPIGGKACAELPDRATVRADLADLLAEGCLGATGNPQIHFDRSLTVSRELPSGIVIQTLAALARSCRAELAPWLMVMSDEPVADACEPGWSGELHEYGWFIGEALSRAQMFPD